MQDSQKYADDLTIVVSAFGSTGNIFIEALVNSVRHIYPDSKILLIGHDIATDMEKINRIRKNTPFVKTSPGSLKIICWNQGMKLVKTKYVLFMDLDTILLKNIDKYLRKLHKDSIDVIFSWRRFNSQWVNTGILIVKKNKKTVDLFDEYEKNMLKDIKSNHNDQYTFINFLNKNIPLKDKSREYQVSIESSGISFLGVCSDYLNNQESIVPWFKDTHIQHLKGVMFTIIVKDDKYNRYVNFIKRDIHCLSREQALNLSYRINLFKKYANKTDAKNIIDVMEIYKGGKFFYCLLRKIKHFIKIFNKTNRSLNRQ